MDNAIIKGNKGHARMVFGFLIDICKETLTLMHEKSTGTNTHRYTHASDVNFAHDRVNWDRMYLDTHIGSSFIKRRMGCDGDDPAELTLAHFSSRTLETDMYISGSVMPLTHLAQSR